MACSIEQRDEWSKLRQDPLRSELVSRIQVARTLVDIRELKEAVHAWVRYHPDDEAMVLGSQALSSAEETLRLRDEWQYWY